MIRPQAIVLPLLRAALPGVDVVSVAPDVDHRTYPMVAVHRAGGTRNPNLPNRHARPVLNIEAVSADGLIEAEELYEDALEAVFAAVAAQTVVPSLGYLQSVREAQGASQSPSSPPDTWAVNGSVQLGVRSA